jgi:hypothetical protein
LSLEPFEIKPIKKSRIKLIGKIRIEDKKTTLSHIEIPDESDLEAKMQRMKNFNKKYYK